VFRLRYTREEVKEEYYLALLYNTRETLDLIVRISYKVDTSRSRIRSKIYRVIRIITLLIIVGYITKVLTNTVITSLYGIRYLIRSIKDPRILGLRPIKGISTNLIRVSTYRLLA